MTKSEQRYLCGAGHARAVWRPPADSEHRREWEKWLKGLASATAAVAVVGLLLASASTTRPLEATAQMEQLARKLEHSKAVHPETAQTIASLIHQPWYDCTQVACTAQLQIRNDAARARLKPLLLKRKPDIQTAGAEAADVIRRTSDEQQ